MPVRNDEITKNIINIIIDIQAANMVALLSSSTVEN